jgi:hypothetical protein
MPIVLKSGILNLLEPSGPVQACKGIVVPYISNREGSNTALSSNIEHQPLKDVAPCPKGTETYSTPLRKSENLAIQVLLIRAFLKL